MRFHFVCKGLFLAGIVTCTMLSACAQGITTAHVLHGGTRCDHVISLINPDNAASIRVAEKLGECPERSVELFGVETLVYGIVRPA